jgi:hypothetical protein
MEKTTTTNRPSRPAQSNFLGAFAAIAVHYTDTLALLPSISPSLSEAWPSHTTKPSHPTPLFLPTKPAAPQIRPVIEAQVK